MPSRLTIWKVGSSKDNSTNRLEERHTDGFIVTAEASC